MSNESSPTKGASETLAKEFDSDSTPSGSSDDFDALPDYESVLDGLVGDELLAAYQAKLRQPPNEQAGYDRNEEMICRMEDEPYGGSNPEHVPPPYTSADLLVAHIDLSQSQKAKVQAISARLHYECTENHKNYAHPFCPGCRNPYSAKASLSLFVARNPGKEPPEVEVPTETETSVLDWQELWDDETTEEWILEPILPARRLIAMFSAAKVGKSLLSLEIAAGVASASRRVLGVQPTRKYSVLYVDFENDSVGDVRTRLKAMGYQPSDLNHLVYLSFPTMAKLDTARGGDELLAAVKEHESELVVIDTVSRAVEGEENSNDTWLNFYRHTGLKLKQAEVACLRLDHTGKDAEKGMRGGSAKYGDVDAVWQLSEVVKGSKFELTCTHSRLPLSEHELFLERTTDSEGRLVHRVQVGSVAAMAVDAKVTELIETMDRLDIDKSLGRDNARDALRAVGVTKLPSNTVISEAIKRRKLLS